MNVFDVDTVGSCTVFEDDLLQEHECSLMLCMLPHLQQPGVPDDNDDLAKMEAVQPSRIEVQDRMTNLRLLCVCSVPKRPTVSCNSSIQGVHAQCKCCLWPLMN